MRHFSIKRLSPLTVDSKAFSIRSAFNSSVIKSICLYRKIGFWFSIRNPASA